MRDTVYTSCGAELVSFGRYRNLPIASLLADNTYVEWLRSQDWLAERDRDLFEALNNCESQEEISAHAFLAELLSCDAFCSRLLQRVYGEKAKPTKIIHKNMNHESELALVLCELEQSLAQENKVGLLVENCDTLGDNFEGLLRRISSWKKGLVGFLGDTWIKHRSELILLKRVLLVERIESGFSFEQMEREAFLSGIRLIVRSEI